MVTVQLEWAEIFLATNVAVMRRIFALRAGMRGAYGARLESAWDYDINGAIAELGAAKWAKAYWHPTVGVTTARDVGRWQIRSKLTEGQRLVVRPTDSDDDVYVSVLVQPPVVTLCGWLYGREAKRPEWLQQYTPRPGDKPRPPMYFVEDRHLHSMIDLEAASADVDGEGPWEP